MFGTHDYSMVENTVLLSHNGIITEKFCNTSSSKYTDLTIQDISKTPTSSENENIRRLLIKESFGNTNLPREITDALANLWRTTTQSHNQSVLRQWFVYGISWNTDPCTRNINSVVIHAVYVHKWLFM